MSEDRILVPEVCFPPTCHIVSKPLTFTDETQPQMKHNHWWWGQLAAIARSGEEWQCVSSIFPTLYPARTAHVFLKQQRGWVLECNTATQHRLPSSEPLQRQNRPELNISLRHWVSQSPSETPLSSLEINSDGLVSRRTISCCAKQIPKGV